MNKGLTGLLMLVAAMLAGCNTAPKHDPQFAPVQASLCATAASEQRCDFPGWPGNILV